MRYCLIDTPIGTCGLAWSEQGLARLQLPESRNATAKRLVVGSANSEFGEPTPRIKRVITMLRQFLAGSKVDFSFIDLDLSDVGPFHRVVYQAARSIG
jgi:methylated-DNA-[protein]-cysteine S-methyltransferase